ncbi:MAG TPA: glycine--tRNA ligase subunit beta [Geminicoccaceae bacterium]
MPDLLLELFSEEIPARMQPRAASDLGELVGRGLEEAELAAGEVRTFATPRRLTLLARGVPERQADVEVERRGPKVDAPEAAIAGFRSSLGTDDVTLSEEEDRKGNRVLVARFTRAGRPAEEIVPTVIEAILKRFPWPKSMRWGTHDVRWVRPLHGIVCLFDGRPVPVAFGPVTAGATTWGHRFMAPGTIEASGFEDYREKLTAAYVQLDPADRRREIRDEADRLAGADGHRLRPDDELIGELAGLVEWPVVLAGRIDDRFMVLPEEVLVTSMRQHQKYLAVEDEAGRLQPRFVMVANLVASDGGRAIVAGNERVLRARLFDAKFFYDQDRRRPLASRTGQLDKVVFHARLGSLGDKTRRLEELARHLAPRVPGAKPDLAVRAAALAKADLVTGMVGEFPELQGVMGRYYAEHDLEHVEVAEAIQLHYAPQGPNDRCPMAPVSVTVALADKIDTLAGFFAIGEKPTGSKDPFALRRAALGAIRLILENRLRLPLRAAFLKALASYGALLEEVDRGQVADDLLAFLADRLKVHLRAAGTRHDLISATFAAGRDDDLVRLLARVEALRVFLETEDGANLLIAHRRASNIVRIEERRDQRSYDGQPDGQRLHAGEEQMLFFRLMTVGGDISSALEREDFGEAMAALARLRQPVDAFFDHVQVNTPEPDLRENRLHLLSQIRSALGTIADFSLIEDSGQPAEERKVA